MTRHAAAETAASEIRTPTPEEIDRIVYEARRMQAEALRKGVRDGVAALRRAFARPAVSAMISPARRA